MLTHGAKRNEPVTQKDHISLWNDCRTILRDNLTDELYKIWFAPVESRSFSDGRLCLAVPSDLFVDQFEDKFYTLLESTINRVYGPGVTIDYTYNVTSDPSSAVTIASSRPSASLKNPVNTQDQIAPNPFHEGVNRRKIEPQLNPTYNFENYCVGESNKLPFTIAEYIGNHPDKTDFNPFFLYGATGVGKTHLIQSIGIRVKERYPQARVLYITSRIFENQYGKAIREKKVGDFINFYEQIHVLLIDDIQELSGKPGIQNAFFPIFNYLHQRGRLLIMTSDRPPVALDGMMDRLLNRFKWGVIEELPAPDLALRKKILHHKAARNGLSLSEEVIDLIAASVTTSIRELEGIVLSLLTRATILNMEITPELAKAVIASSVKVNTKRINFDMIVENTAAYYNLDPDVIFKKNRVKDVAEARQVVMYLADKLTDLSASSIGRKLARSHTTVSYGVDAIRDRLDVEPALVDTISQIEESIRR